MILVHGRGASKGNELNDHVMALVKRLLDSRLSILMLDLRGHGDSDFARMTYGMTERLDVLGAVDWLLASRYRRGHLGVLGASMGGSAAIGAVVGDSAFADFAAVLGHNFPRVMRTRFALAVLPGALWLVKRSTGVARDRFITVEHVHHLARANGTDAWISDNDDHVGIFASDPALSVERVSTFFSDNLAPARRRWRRIDLLRLGNFQVTFD